MNWYCTDPQSHRLKRIAIWPNPAMLSPSNSSINGKYDNLFELIFYPLWIVSANSQACEWHSMPFVPVSPVSVIARASCASNEVNENWSSIALSTMATAPTAHNQSPVLAIRHSYSDGECFRLHQGNRIRTFYLISLDLPIHSIQAQLPLPSPIRHIPMHDRWLCFDVIWCKQ